MKGEHYSINAQRCKYVVTDYVTTSLAFFLFNIFRYYYIQSAHNIAPDLGSYLLTHKIVLEQIFVPLGLMGVYALSGYYNSPFVKSRLSEFSSTFYSAMANSVLIYLFMLINDSSGMRRKDYLTIIVLFGLLFSLTYIGRLIITASVIRKLRRREWNYVTLIVGNSKAARKIYDRLRNAHSVWGYEVAGFVRIPGEREVQDDLPVFDLDEVERVCRTHKVDQIILAPERRSDKGVMAMLGRLFPIGLPVKIAPDLLSYITGNIRLNDLMGVPLVDLTSPRMNEFQKNVKRVFDISASVMTMIVLSPVLAWISVMVKIGSKGPVIYSQERIGKKQKPFKIYKFRSMRMDAEADGPQLSSENDSRITPFGKIMRKYRLDELPQFWNVIRGDMSLVGPRPERDFFIRQIIQEAPYFGLVFQVRPGVTSLGMVKFGYASDVEQMVERSRYDLIYLNNMSLSTDAKIMIYTVKTVLTGKGK